MEVKMTNMTVEYLRLYRKQILNVPVLFNIKFCLCLWVWYYATKCAIQNLMRPSFPDVNCSDNISLMSALNSVWCICYYKLEKNLK